VAQWNLVFFDCAFVSTRQKSVQCNLRQAQGRASYQQNQQLDQQSPTFHYPLPSQPAGNYINGDDMCTVGWLEEGECTGIKMLLVSKPVNQLSYPLNIPKGFRSIPFGNSSGSSVL
jgi:hypothetical protein